MNKQKDLLEAIETAWIDYKNTNKVGNFAVHWSKQIDWLISTIWEQEKQINQLENIIQSVKHEVEGIYKPDEIRILAVLEGEK